MDLRPAASPSRYHRRLDEESGGGLEGEEQGGSGEICSHDEDAFDIPPKNAPVDRLRRWRKAALVLNASRRFRYTLDLKKEEEKEQIRRKIRAHAQVIRAAFLFKEAGEKEVPGTIGVAPVLPTGGFGIRMDQLTSMTRDQDFSALQEYGGVNGLSDLLKTNLDKGISADDADILCRKDTFGTNTYPRKKGRSFWVFLWEAVQDLTLVILIMAAAVSLVLGIKTEFWHKIGLRNGDSYRVLLIDDASHTEKIVGKALPQVVPSLTVSDAIKLFNESRENGVAVVIVTVKEHAEFYAQMMIQCGLKSAIEPDSSKA